MPSLLSPGTPAASLSDRTELLDADSSTRPRRADCTRGDSVLPCGNGNAEQGLDTDSRCRGRRSELPARSASLAVLSRFAAASLAPAQTPAASESATRFAPGEHIAEEARPAPRGSGRSRPEFRGCPAGSALPAKSVTRPPASSTSRIPAAVSQGFRLNSQKASMRPQAT